MKIDVKGQDVIIDDYPTIGYRYWAFHLVYACASMYLMMTMTNWYDPADSLEASFTKGDQSGFYIQGATTLVVLLIYLIFLVAPLFCPNSKMADQLEGQMGSRINSRVVSPPQVAL